MNSRESEKYKKIAVGADHAGFKYKQGLRDYLENQGQMVFDFGTLSDKSVDYPDYVHPVAIAIAMGKHDKGILICGSGNGVAITANKHQDVRAALCWTTELAQLARSHNNANILCIPARFVSFEETLKMVDVFLATEFDGERHQRRVEKING